MGSVMSVPPVILLAGGAATRLGMPKGLITDPRSGQTLLEMQLRRLEEIPLTHVVLVFGHQASRYRERFSWLPPKDQWWSQYLSMKLAIAVNARPEWGPFSSLQTGLQFLMGENLLTGGCYVLPIDCPAADQHVWARMQALTTDSDVKVVSCRYQERGGHPIWLSEDFSRTMLGLDPQQADSRLDWQIAGLDAYAKRAVTSDDPRILINCNTPVQWEEYADFYRA